MCWEMEFLNCILSWGFWAKTRFFSYSSFCLEFYPSFLARQNAVNEYSRIFLFSRFFSLDFLNQRVEYVILSIPPAEGIVVCSKRLESFVRLMSKASISDWCPRLPPQIDVQDFHLRLMSKTSTSDWCPRLPSQIDVQDFHLRLMSKTSISDWCPRLPPQIDVQDFHLRLMSKTSISDWCPRLPSLYSIAMSLLR